MKDKKDAQPVLEELIKNELSKLNIHAKQLQYKMDFGTTEILLKFSLN